MSAPKDGGCEQRRDAPHQMDDEGLVTWRSAATLPREERRSAEAASTLAKENRTIAG
jgi:hypothetical protein